MDLGTVLAFFVSLGGGVLELPVASGQFESLRV
jgi:hypothetical protein